MSKLDRWVDHKIVQNLFIWFFLFLILLITIQIENRIVASLFVIALLAPPVYINNLIILRYFKQAIVKFIVLFLVNTLLFSAISVFILQKMNGQSFELDKFFNFIGIMILTLSFSSALKIARDSFTRRQQEKEAELKLLKAQLNPHFLFNTLNNLYGLSVIKSDKLPELMLKLSDLLRYSLYETKEIMVPFEKELTYIENYMALEKIRLEDKTTIEFSIEDDFSGDQIAPMLLIVFVENAFKHLGMIAKEKSSVSVTLKKINKEVHFTCINTVDSNSPGEANLEQGKSGIGLQNAKKRLSLIYPDKYNLTIIEKKSAYHVYLKIQL